MFRKKEEFKIGEEVYLPNNSFSPNYTKGEVVSRKGDHYLIKYNHVSYPEVISVDKRGIKTYKRAKKPIESERFVRVDENNIFKA